MIEKKVYDLSGKQVDTLVLNEEVFGQEYNEALIHQVVVAQLANKRQGTKSTLTRAEVRGGGVKPWRQKGTGRARQGSIRSPQWVKGGVVFAPKPRDFSQKINKKAKLAAIKSALSAKAATENEFIIVKDLDIAAAKTKEMAKALKALNCTRRTLIVLSDSDNQNAVLAARNIPDARICNVDLINVYDLVANTNCLITVSAVKKLEEVYGLC